MKFNKSWLISALGMSVFVVFFNNCGSRQNLGTDIEGIPSTTFFSANNARPLKVALLGDTDIKESFRSALVLARDEGADVIMINGDFVYISENQNDNDHKAEAKIWKQMVLDTIDIDRIAVIGSLGNHDVDHNDNGATAMEDRLLKIFDEFRTDRNQLKSKCTGRRNLSSNQDTILVNEVCTFGNVSIVASAIQLIYDKGFSKSYFEGQLESKLQQAPSSNWKLVGYHYTLKSMNRGGKGDQNTHKFFETIRKFGGIGAQAHTHTAMASCSVNSEFRKGNPVRCHPNYGSDLRTIEPGVGLYLDASIIGRGSRYRVPCDNEGSSDCSHLIDGISESGYSFRGGEEKKVSGGNVGVLFINFNEGHNPNKASAYYKNINGNEVFGFNINRKVSTTDPDPDDPDGVTLGALFRADGLWWRVTNEPDGHCRLRDLTGVDTSTAIPSPIPQSKLRYKDNDCKDAAVPDDPNPDDPDGVTLGALFRADGLWWRVTNEPDGHCRLRDLTGVDTSTAIPSPIPQSKLRYKDNDCKDAAVPDDPNPDDPDGVTLGALFRADGLWWRVTNEPDGHCRLRDLSGVDTSTAIPSPIPQSKLRYKGNDCKDVE